MPEFGFPKDGIVWRSYDDTIDLLNTRQRPVLLLVLDGDGLRWPFLREIFRLMPKNERLRNVLNGPCAAMLLKANEMPEDMKLLGAGTNYHIAILSPSGLTPMVTFDYMTREPAAVVEAVTRSLEAVAPIWTDRWQSQQSQ
jgi:hypothetical protein